MSSTDISRKHDLNLDSHGSLRERDVPDGMVDVVILRLTRGDEITLLIFLNLGSLLSKLSSNDNFTSFYFFNFHDVSDYKHGS